jgi:hypothetical protein
MMSVIIGQLSLSKVNGSEGGRRQKAWRKRSRGAEGKDLL